jgi:hypothetical protein
MRPVHVPCRAEHCAVRHAPQPVARPNDLRALASAVGNRQFARLVQPDGSSGAKLQRLAYWAEVNPNKKLKNENIRRSGISVHNEVLPAMGRENWVFTEAPVPDADKSAAALEDTHGYADLYKATTTVGVEFAGHQTPRMMESKQGTTYRGKPFEFLETSAPAVEQGQDGPVVTRLGNAPAEIAIGDLKGGFNSTEAADAPEQLDNYIKGFRIAAKELNEYGRRRPGLVEPFRGSRTWNPKVRKFRKRELDVPDYYTPGKAHKQPSKRLLLVGASGREDARWSARHNVRGKLYVFEDPEREGVWSYVWAPDQEIALGELPEHVRRLGPEIAERLRTPLLAPPLARRVREGPPRPAAGRRPAPRRRLARQPATTFTDPFKYDQWQRAHLDLSSRVEGVEDDPGFVDAEAAAAVDEANATVRKFGLRAPKVRESKLAGGRIVKEIRLWTGASGKLLGTFRRLFGSVFTKVAELYFKVRDRVRAMLKPTAGKGFGSGFGGAALKAAYAVLKGAAGHIVSKTAERLKTSLTEGTQKKLKSLIGGTEIESRIKEVTDVVKGLESGVVEKLEDVGNGVVEKYKSVLDKIENVKEIVGKGLSIVDKVRWGARVIACLSPPGVGCLWILAQSVLEKAAARVVDTCWFKRKITPLVNKFSWVRELPGRLAEAIRERIVPLLPGPLKDVFAKIDTSPVHVGEGDIGCNTDDDPERDRLTPERRALYELIERVGEERYEALVDAMWAVGVRFDKKLTVAEINKARDIIVSSGVTAEQLRHYTKWFAPYADKRKLGPLGEFLSGLREMDTDAPPTFGEPEGGGGAGEGAGGTAIEAVPTTSPSPQGKYEPYEIVTFGKFDRNVAKDTEVTLDVTVKVRGRTVTLRRVKLVVVENRPTADGGARVVLSPGKPLVFDVRAPSDTGAPTLITLSADSRLWRTFPSKSAAKRPPAPAAEPEPALAP